MTLSAKDKRALALGLWMHHEADPYHSEPRPSFAKEARALIRAHNNDLLGCGRKSWEDYLVTTPQETAILKALRSRADVS